jgi:hypothetical protein
MTNAVEQSAMRKIYLRLLPLAVVSYLLAYIDRINVSFAGLTMRDDLNMWAAAFGLTLGTFYPIAPNDHLGLDLSPWLTQEPMAIAPKTDIREGLLGHSGFLRAGIAVDGVMIQPCPTAA